MGTSYALEWEIEVPQRLGIYAIRIIRSLTELLPV